MQKFVFVLLAILSVALGATFIFSAYTKLFPIQAFEYTMVEFAHLPWLVAAIAARLLIGLETALGALMVLHLFGKGKWVLKLSLAILLLFSVYLIYLWATQGNDVNCGCFGDMIWMSPSSSLIKNAVMIVAVLILLKHKGWQANWAQITAPALLVIVTSLPFILFGLPDDQPNWLKKDKFQVDLSALYEPKLAKPIPATDLRQGKHIIVFLSLSCPHCRMAAHKIQIMKEKNTSLPFYFVIAGKEQYEASFWKETKAKDIPHTKLDADAFTAIAGFSWPVIYWVNNSIVEAQSTYITLDQQAIENWLK